MGTPEMPRNFGSEATRQSRLRNALARATRGAIGRSMDEQSLAAQPLTPRIIQPGESQGRIEQRARTVAARQKEGLIRTPHALAVQETMKADRRRGLERLNPDKRIALALIDYLREVNDPFVSREMTEFLNAMRTNFTSIQREALEIYAYVQPGKPLDSHKYIYSFAVVPTAESEADTKTAAQTANEVTRAYFGSKYIEYDNERAGKHVLYYAETTYQDEGPSHSESPLPIQHCYHVIPPGNGRMIEISIPGVNNIVFATQVEESVLVNRAEPYAPRYAVK